MRVLAYLTPLAALCACATSEDVPRFDLIDGALVTTDGGPTGPGGQGNGGMPNTGAAPGNGGSAGGAAGTCSVASCPSCQATFGTACCQDNGTCGCKLFGLLNCN